MTSQGL